MPVATTVRKSGWSLARLEETVKTQQCAGPPQSFKNAGTYHCIRYISCVTSKARVAEIRVIPRDLIAVVAAGNNP